MDSLRFYDYASADSIEVLEIGKVAPRSSDDTTLRIGNLSETYQAEDVTVVVEDAGDGAQIWLSLDGDIFGATIAVGDIPPNSISGPFWMRRVTPSTQPDGAYGASLSASASSWTYAADTGASESLPLATPDNPPND